MSMAVGEKSKCSLREAQMLMLDILKEVHRVCTENGIEYFLVCGTLLGAVRHKGFIPWDDDVDIGMTRENYIKFKEIAQEKLGPNYFLQTRDTDKHYNLYHIPMKVRMNNTIFEEIGEEGTKADYHRGIYIDIFPLDRIPESRYHRFIQKKYRMALMKAKLHVTGKGVSLKQKLRTVLSTLIKPMSTEKIYKKAEESVKWNNESKEPFYNYGPELLWDKVFKEEDMFPLSKVEFEGCEFYAPHNPDGVLTVEYGNYMQLPPENERVWHAKDIYKIK